MLPNLFLENKFNQWHFCWALCETMLLELVISSIKSCLFLNISCSSSSLELEAGTTSMQHTSSLSLVFPQLQLYYQRCHVMLFHFLFLCSWRFALCGCSPEAELSLLLLQEVVRTLNTSWLIRAITLCDHTVNCVVHIPLLPCHWLFLKVPAWMTSTSKMAGKKSSLLYHTRFQLIYQSVQQKMVEHMQGSHKGIGRRHRNIQFWSSKMVH